VSTQASECIIRVEGRAGRITLNRPDALNALTYGMLTDIVGALAAWQSDPAVELVILDGAGDRALCAGGDVISLYNARSGGSAANPDFAARFWRDEYQLNSAIHHYPKPYVAIMDGIVMGGGVGLSAHGRHRIVTEKTMVAMPETTIGLIPDVGGTWLLGRAQGRFGEYLGLTGARMNGSDAIQMGFADTFVSRSRVPDLVRALTASSGGDVEAVIEDAAEPVPLSPIAARHDLISRIFSADSVEAIVEKSLGSADEVAQRIHADLATRSPLALKLTLEAIRRARGYASLEEALEVEYRLVTRLYDKGEFIEGIRALLVDKDKAPKWQPPTLAEVSRSLVEQYFAPLTSRPALGLAAVRR